jgi:hypothetical protein
MLIKVLYSYKFYFSINPFNSFSFYPFTFPSFIVLILINSNAMLFTSHPLSFILSSINPFKDSVTVSLIIYKFTNIFFSIRPYQMSLSMHFIILPISIIFFTVTPLIHTLSIYLIHFKIPIIHRTVCKR